IVDAGLPPLRGRVADAAWVRLARAAEAHGTALLVSTPYPLTGTTSEAMLRAEPSRGRWRGGLLTGVETTLRLEKHRRKRPGESVAVLFHAPEALAVGCWPLADAYRSANGQRRRRRCSKSPKTFHLASKMQATGSHSPTSAEPSGITRTKRSSEKRRSGQSRRSACPRVPASQRANWPPESPRNCRRRPRWSSRARK